MSDFLSQDQIDALLKQQGEGAFEVNSVDDVSSDDTASTDTGGGLDFDNLNKAVEMLNEQSSTVITTLLNKETAFTGESSAVDSEKVSEVIDSEALKLTIPMEGAAAGIITAIVPKAIVARLSDLMMMGDGEAEYSEEHKDAIMEIFNQIFGAFTTELGGKIGDSVSTGAIQVADYEASETFDGAMSIETISLEEAGEFKFLFVIKEELAEKLSEAFKESNEDDFSALTGSDDSASSGISDSEMEDLSSIGGGGFSGDDFGQGFQSSVPAVNAPEENVGMLLDIVLDVYIELGSTKLSIKRILELAPGSIVELDRLAGEPVDLMVNGKVIAKGEVVVVDENFGIRIVSLVSPEDRIKSLA